MQFSKQYLPNRFTKWAIEYGDVYSLKLANSTMIVLNSVDAIRHVMEKNSVFSSDRPPSHFGELVEGQNNDLVLYVPVQSIDLANKEPYMFTGQDIVCLSQAQLSGISNRRG
jgi:hypothetical protein